MKKKTLVFGASLKPERYANLAIHRLKASGHEVVAFGIEKGTIAGVNITTELVPYNNIDTITLYLRAVNQRTYYNYLMGLNPNRILFNPGTENPEFFELLRKENIAFETACTLVLLSTNQY